MYSNMLAKHNLQILFLKKQNDDIMFEYRVDVLKDNINLATLMIHTPELKYFIDFDAE